MGGWGSGPRLNSRETTSDYHELDVRHWQRHGLLVAGQSFVCQWWKVKVAGAVNVLARPARVILSHIQSGEHNPVWLEWTPCNYGGLRAWFLCPARGCGRRVAILYGGATVACRHCHQLAYPSEQESKRYRSLHRPQAIRAKLGGSLSLADPFPARPKGMHRRTYRRLYVEGAKHEQAFLGGMLAFLDFQRR